VSYNFYAASNANLPHTFKTTSTPLLKYIFLDEVRFRTTSCKLYREALNIRRIFIGYFKITN
jgi:hypothetical protein